MPSKEFCHSRPGNRAHCDASTGTELVVRRGQLLPEQCCQAPANDFPNLFQMTVAGNLIIPKNLFRTENASAIVVSHPMGAVKDQSANLYITKLVEQSFVTIALEVAFWGDSEGESRNAVLPDLCAESFTAAVNYLGTLGFGDRERIGAVGICGSGSFVTSAAKIDTRISTIATVSMYDMGAANRDGLRHAISAEQRQEIVVATSQQRCIEVDAPHSSLQTRRTQSGAKSLTSTTPRAASSTPTTRQRTLRRARPYPVISDSTTSIRSTILRPSPLAGCSSYLATKRTRASLAKLHLRRLVSRRSCCGFRMLAT